MKWAQSFTYLGYSTKLYEQGQIYQTASGLPATSPATPESNKVEAREAR
jgi:hypothetical protein